MIALRPLRWLLFSTPHRVTPCSTGWACASKARGWRMSIMLTYPCILSQARCRCPAMASDHSAGRSSDHRRLYKDCDSDQCGPAETGACGRGWRFVSARLMSPRLRPSQDHEARVIAMLSRLAPAAPLFDCGAHRLGDTT